MHIHRAISKPEPASVRGFVASARNVLSNALNFVCFFSCIAQCQTNAQKRKRVSRCAQENPVSRCTPGLSIHCPCNARREGYQVCNTNGTWDPCDCSFCGDGRVDQGEECDPGKYGFNDYYGGCRQNCTLAPYCGDGEIDKYHEECEIGVASITAEQCRDCTLVRCGDGIVDAGESCDNGDYYNHGSYGGCTGDCMLAAHCGDGLVDFGYEECDYGSENSDTTPDSCRTDCRKARCGDGVLDSGEACDDGNTTMACKFGDTNCTVCGTSCQYAPGVIFQALPFPVTDAEYSRALDRLIAVGNTSSSLVIYDPFHNNFTTIEMESESFSVSVGPSGEKAAVAHEYSITLVDLVEATVVQTFFTPWSMSDVVLADNGFIYAFPGNAPGNAPGNDDAILSVEIDTGSLTRFVVNPVQPGTKAKLHPEGTKLYGAQYSLERYDITDGIATKQSSSHSGYDTCSNLWISQDGSRIFTACGNVFVSSENNTESASAEPNSRSYTQDMQFIQTLGLGRILHLDQHQRDEGVVAAIEWFIDPYYMPDPRISQKLHIFTNRHRDESTYSLSKVIGIPDYRTARSDFATNGKFVFFSRDGLDLVVVVQVDGEAGWYHDFIVVLPA